MNKLIKVTKKFIPQTNATVSTIMDQEVAIGSMKKCITVKLIPCTHLKNKLDGIMVQYRENLKPITGWKIEFNEMKPDRIGFKSDDIKDRIAYDPHKDMWHQAPDYKEVGSMISDLIEFTGVLNESICTD